MGRAREAADRIRAEVPIVDVLYDYGYRVHPDGEDREQQFSCDLHGDGSDTKPSARVYPESASFHCFACGRSRDAITLVREKEGVEFWQAVKMLEAKHNLLTKFALRHVHELFGPAVLERLDLSVRLDLSAAHTKEIADLEVLRERSRLFRCDRWVVGL